MTAAPTNNDATRDRADADQPAASNGTTRYRLPFNSRDVTPARAGETVAIVGAPDLPLPVLPQID
jgi:hypothetical protein